MTQALHVVGPCRKAIGGAGLSPEWVRSYSSGREPRESQPDPRAFRQPRRGDITARAAWSDVAPSGLAAREGAEAWRAVPGLTPPGFASDLVPLGLAGASRSGTGRFLGGL